MPYADPKKRRAVQAAWYRDKYGSDVAFQVRETNRKADWLQTEAGRKRNAEASKRARAKRRAS